MTVGVLSIGLLIEFEISSFRVSSFSSFGKKRVFRVSSYSSFGNFEFFEFEFSAFQKKPSFRVSS